jgi:hypothetical protein
MAGTPEIYVLKVPPFSDFAAICPCVSDMIVCVLGGNRGEYQMNRAWAAAMSHTDPSAYHGSVMVSWHPKLITDFVLSPDVSLMNVSFSSSPAEFEVSLDNMHMIANCPALMKMVRNRGTGHIEL